MNFLDSLKRKFTPEGRRSDLLDAAKTGETLESFVEEGHFQVLIDLVFEEMEREAYEQFKKLDPQDVMGVAQVQKVGQVLKEVRRRVELKIKRGFEARQQLSEAPNQEEDQ